jgi:hypothetical protein
VPRGDGGLLVGGAGRQPGSGHELRREQAGQPLLAAADEDLLPVFVDAPADREPELGERLVEGDQVPVPLRVGQHSVTVEDEGACSTVGHRDHQAWPTLPNRSM